MRDEFLEPILASDREVADEVGLRPRLLDDFVGQRELKEHLDIVLGAAKQRGQAADHILLAGPPGLGKTTMACIVAAEMGVALHITSGPALERAGDLAALLTKLGEGDVLFMRFIVFRDLSKKSCTQPWRTFRLTSSLAKVRQLHQSGLHCLGSL